MSDPVHLIDRYLDGTLTVEEREQLEQDLTTSPAYADAFAHAMMVDSLLAQRFERDAITSTMQLGDGSFVGEGDLSLLLDDYDHAEAALVTIDDLAADELPLEFNDKTDNVSWSEGASAMGYGVRLMIRSEPRLFAGALVAAVVLLSLWLINPFAGNDSPVILDIPDVVQSNDRSAVAKLTAEHNAAWDQHPGKGLYPGDRFTLTQGFAEITTGRGAIVILEAPTTIELIDDDNAIRLHTGKLAGVCETDSSKGLVVQTPHIDVTDLGTRFGVQLDQQGDLNMAVFDGEVIVAPRTDEQDQHQDGGVLLKAGQTIAANKDGELEAAFHQLKPDHRFLPSWRDIIGQVRVTGQARFFVEPPADISVNALIDPDHMIIFQEKTAVIEEPIGVRIELSGVAGNPQHTQIPAGTTVISYMVHFSPAKFSQGQHGHGGDTPSTAVATIEFPGRVLGLIGGGKPMSATDELLGLDSVVYVDPANKVYNNVVDSWPTDSFEITGENQNILEIKLTAAVHSDQARVLIEMPTTN